MKTLHSLRKNTVFQFSSYEKRVISGFYGTFPHCLIIWNRANHTFFFTEGRQRYSLNLGAWDYLRPEPMPEFSLAMMIIE